jgi:hypothetical protein
MARNTIRIRDEKELTTKFSELAHIALNLRFWTRYWKEHYGSDARAKKNLWENKMDSWLRNMGLDDIDRLKAIQVFKDADT